MEQVVLRPLVAAKRAALAAGECPQCERSSSSAAAHGQAAERLSRLERLQRKLLRQADTGLEMPPLLPPLAPTSPSLREPVPPPPPPVPPLQAQVDDSPVATPTVGESSPEPEPAARAAVHIPTVQQAGAEAAASIFRRMVPRTSTPRSFVVYAPAAVPGQRAVSSDERASKLAKELALDAPDAVSCPFDPAPRFLECWYCSS